MSNTFQLFTWFFIFLLASTNLNGQNIDWQERYGGSSSERLETIHQLPDGGYILGGYSYSPISGDKTENVMGQSDFWIVRLDANRNVIWDQTIGGNDIDQLHALQVTQDGGFIATGMSYSNISGDKNQNAYGFYDYWVVKLDGNGNIQWQKTLGGSEYDWSDSVVQTYDGGYVIAGTSTSDISGNRTVARQGSRDIWLVKLDNAGNELWQKSIGGTGSDEVEVVQQTPDGGLILGANSTSGISGDKTTTSRGGYDFWLVKMDANANIQWQSTAGAAWSDRVIDLAQTQDGGYILGGYSNSAASGEKSENSMGGYDFWVVKFDGMGTLEWENTIGGSGYEAIHSILQAPDGTYLLGGRSDSNISGDKTHNADGMTDFWLVKLNATGTIQWQNTLGGNHMDILTDMELTSDGGYLLGGISMSNVNGDQTEASYGLCCHDYWLVKMEKDTTLPTGIAAFHFENSNGVTQNSFLCGEDVYMDGTASQDESHYFIDAWLRPIGSTGAFQYAAGLGWSTGQVGTLNLSALFANQGFTFSAGFEYQIKLAVQNSPQFNWVEITHTFSVILDNYDPNFTLYPSLHVNMTNILVDAVSNPNPASTGHWWEIFYAGPLGQVWGYNTPVPGNSVVCCSSTFASFGANLFYDTWYYVKHGIWDDCQGWIEVRQPFYVRSLKGKFGKTQLRIEYGEPEMQASTLEESIQLTEKEATALLDNQRIPQPTNNQQLTVFPTPASSTQPISIAISEGHIEQVQLFDLSGKAYEILPSNLGDSTITFQVTQPLSSGIYIAQITTNEGVQMVEKVMIR